MLRGGSNKSVFHLQRTKEILLLCRSVWCWYIAQHCCRSQYTVWWRALSTIQTDFKCHIWGYVRLWNFMCAHWHTRTSPLQSLLVDQSNNSIRLCVWVCVWGFSLLGGFPDQTKKPGEEDPLWRTNPIIEHLKKKTPWGGGGFFRSLMHTDLVARSNPHYIKNLAGCTFCLKTSFWHFTDISHCFSDYWISLLFRNTVT